MLIQYQYFHQIIPHQSLLVFPERWKGVYKFEPFAALNCDRMGEIVMATLPTIEVKNKRQQN
ncbi:MAG: hypothetical protein ACFCAD_25650 [Pleurocapsa sp.]